MLDDPARGGDGVSNATTMQQFGKTGFSIDGPTVEQPALGIGDTISGKIAAPRAPIGMADQTAELALDDLGLDLGRLEATGSSLLDDSQLTRALSLGEQGAETLVAGLDDTARQLLEQAGNTQVTELLPLTDLGGDTSRIVALDLNLDADSTAATGKRLTPEFNLDLDVGVPEQTADGEYQRTQRIDQAITEIDSTQRDLEPVSMSEVGTKLDLARAYMDMGDPDGARRHPWRSTGRGFADTAPGSPAPARFHSGLISHAALRRRRRVRRAAAIAAGSSRTEWNPSSNACRPRCARSATTTSH